MGIEDGSGSNHTLQGDPATPGPEAESALGAVSTPEGGAALSPLALALRELQALQEITDTVLAHLTQPDLLDALLASLMRIMHSDNAAILLLDRTQSDLTLHAVRGPEEAVMGQVRVPVGEGVAGRIVATGEPLVISDLTAVPVVNPFLQENLRSLVGVPLVVEGRTIGAVHVDSVHPNRYGPADARLLQLVADRIALALDRAQLFEEVAAARTAAAKRASEYQATLEGMTEGVVVYDDQANIVYENATMTRLLGFDEVPGYRTLPLDTRARLMDLRDERGRSLPPNELPPMRALRGESFRQTQAMDIRLRSLHGQELWFQVSAAPVRDAEGRIVGASSVWRDITRQRHFERERAALLATTQMSLAESQQSIRRLQAIQAITDVSLTALGLDELLHALLERLLTVMRVDSATILLLDDEGATLRVRAARGLEEEVAVGVRVPVGEGFAGRIAATRAPLVVDDIKQFDVVSPFLQEKLSSVVGVPLLVDARVIGVLHVGSASPRHFTKEDTHLLAVVADRVARGIERAQLLDALRELMATLETRVEERTAQLAEANAELEAFGYSVSHDLRAPLRAMAGFAVALQEDYGDRLDETGLMYAKRIIAAASRMDGLIQDLLAYSRLSRADMRPQRVELSSVVAEALRMLEGEIAERKAQITVEGTLPAVRGHQPTLVQVVANLLSNAIKFVAPGVEPRVRVWSEERTSETGIPLVRLSVADNGIGIAPEHQERVFRVFERLHGNEAYPGTGIGLAIVRKGVERLGGRAGVASRVGEGSEFWIELPGVAAGYTGGDK